MVYYSEKLIKSLLIAFNIDIKIVVVAGGSWCSGPRLMHLVAVMTPPSVVYQCFLVRSRILMKETLGNVDPMAY